MIFVGRLDGKVVLITGAGHGQGRSHAIRMAEEGADLILLDVCETVSDRVGYPMANKDELNETASLVHSAGRRSVVRVADVRDVEALKEAVDGGLEAFGHIDVACANAGLISYGLGWELTEEDWETIIDVNLRGVWNTMRAVVPPMIAARSGSIICTSSAAGLRGMGSMSHYSAAKFGVVGLAKSFAIELADHNVRVNVVHPTGVKSFMTESDDPFAAALFERYPDLVIPTGINLMRTDGFIDPVDVSNAMVWLASDEARFVTGIQLPVDAGYSTKP